MLIGQNNARLKELAEPCGITLMNKSERYISRLLFKNKILESDKQTYEDLFVSVMSLLLACRLPEG